MERGWWRLPPNCVTLARMALTPFIGLALARSDYGQAFPLIFVAGVSDAVDGWLARRFGWGSAFGERLDPIADKLMVAVAYLGLGAGGGLPVWLVVLVLGRDLAILLTAGALMALSRARRFPPSGWGKVSTIGQMTLGGVAVLAGAAPEWGFRGTVAPLTWVVAGLTVVSWFDYGRRGWWMWRNRE